MHTECSVEIDVPPERVWPVITDVERWPEWTPTMRSVELLRPGPLAQGTEARISQPRFGTRTWRVTSIDPGKSFTWETRGTGTVMVASHVITPRGNGESSTVTLGVDSSGWAVSLLGWLLVRTARRFVEAEAEGLKRRVEAG